PELSEIQAYPLAPRPSARNRALLDRARALSQRLRATRPPHVVSPRAPELSPSIPPSTERHVPRDVPSKFPPSASRDSAPPRADPRISCPRHKTGIGEDVRMVHAQFETIHPFLDGNGRVGRMLIPLLMVSEGILE